MNIGTTQNLKQNLKQKQRNIWKRIFFLFILISIGGITFYVQDYYRADDTAKLALQSDESVIVSKQADGSILFQPSNHQPNPGGNHSLPASGHGLVFYPGGKVEYTAYAPLMHELAKDGWTCILLHMPLNLAVLDIDAGDDLPEQFQEIENWYIGGHSLGGSMAASFIADSDDYDGLVLLASYSTVDLTTQDLDVYSIYGTEDLVLNRENYETYRSNLPHDIQELVIDGGCHAYFGHYGAQDGDGIPTITQEEQLKQTVEFLRPKQ